jgi:hypothetical protein
MVNPRLILAVGAAALGVLGVSKTAQYQSNISRMDATTKSMIAVSQEHAARAWEVSAEQQKEILATQEKEQSEAFNRKLTRKDEKILLYKKSDRSAKPS